MVLLCRDQLKITTDRLCAQPVQAAPNQTLDLTSPRPPAINDRSFSIKDKEDLQLQTEEEASAVVEQPVNPDAADEKQEDPILIFSEQKMKQLQRRTEELKTERAMQKNKFK